MTLPRRTAAVSDGTTPSLLTRDAAIARVGEVGREQWRKEAKVRQQARVENTFGRYKAVFGGRLRARTTGGQQSEARAGGFILNLMLALGAPVSGAVAAQQGRGSG